VLAEGPSRSPAIALISGPPGIGKTRLLDVVAARASDRHGYAVLRAQAAELERDLAWGVVRQLFAPLLRSAADTSPGGVFSGAASLALPVLGLQPRGPAGADALSARLHGLYWLTANLAERRPTMLLVDDVQWADPASGRFVDYLARRLADLAVVLAVTVRSGDRAAREHTIPQLSGIFVHDEQFTTGLTRITRAVHHADDSVELAFRERERFRVR
jgi:hypothetical protein